MVFPHRRAALEKHARAPLSPQPSSSQLACRRLLAALLWVAFAFFSGPVSFVAQRVCHVRSTHDDDGVHQLPEARREVGNCP